MEFIHGKIGDKLLEAIKASAEVNGAVAYFRPDGDTQSILKKIPKLQLIVSDDFTINNPYHLEELSKIGHAIKVLDSDVLGLHAKVIVGKKRNGEMWAVVGSSNLTHKGLFRNEEACIWLGHNSRGEIENILSWLNRISKIAKEPNWQLKKKIFDTMGPKVKPIANSRENKCWVIKCHDNSGTNYWEQFLADGVIAIGWERLAKDPNKLTREQLISELMRKYPGYSNSSYKRDATIIKKFCEEIQAGDKVIICNGYATNMKKDLFVYGIATIDGKFEFDKNSKWWKKKISASIQSIEDLFPVQKVRTILKKGTMRLTLHHIKAEDFNNFCKMLNGDEGN